MSRATQNRLRLAAEIHRSGHPAESPCDRCFLSNKSCVVMSTAGRLRCSECVRLGRPCVNLSWESLDRTREEYSEKVRVDEEKLADLLARLLRNKKILRQAEERARKKAECLASELEQSGELEEPEPNCPAADALVGLSPAIWSTNDFLNTSIDGLFDGGTSATVAGSS